MNWLCPFSKTVGTTEFLQMLVKEAPASMPFFCLGSTAAVRIEMSTQQNDVR